MSGWLVALVVVCVGVVVAATWATPEPVPEPAPERAQIDAAEGCEFRPDLVVVVELDRARWPNLTAHVERAQELGGLRHLHVARDEAEENREDALRGIPTRSGYDRDEYPPAFSDEGGRGASVEYVPSSENRSQGAVMGAALEPYCDGQTFELVTP